MTRRILLIEDEPLTQDIICTLLQGQGYVVEAHEADWRKYSLLTR